ncbi:hypothetical protein [Legionella worsleiensis]|uniref:LigA, interaptin n=1 Tax=Legionella worsleiensis TaxID=45076 RepID=A0A0W1ALB7_9GAMM|nr:hypothetical protein [Legionella worsleiensis]KTD82113.1 LigA, interaptin [Legionella worsleiensis]STY31441.1 LigA, interaptin [Legionella worsleiensis]
MKSALDILIAGNVTEFVKQLETFSQQDKTLSDDLKSTIKILTFFGKEASESQFELLLELKEHLKNHHVLLNDIAGLFDYPPYPNLIDFSKQIKKNSLELRAYIDFFDKDPKAGRNPKVTKGLVAQLTEDILEEHFDTSRLGHVVANIQNLEDGSNLPSSRQMDLVQQVVYINAVGRECPLSVKNRTYTDLTNQSRVQLRYLSDLFIERVNDPLSDIADRIKAQLNLIAVMREQYFRCTGVFLNITQIVAVLLTLNELNHNGSVELPPDANQYHTKAFLAALQWAFTQGNKESSAQSQLPLNTFSSTDVKNFFTFIGVHGSELSDAEPEEHYTEEYCKAEIVGLSKNTDMKQAFRVPSHHGVTYQDVNADDLNYSLEYLQSIHLALNTAKPGQPIVLIARTIEHAQALNNQLSDYCKIQGKSVELKTFSGMESVETRRRWFRSGANVPRIAITLPDCALYGEFNSIRSNGCLAIQTYVNKPAQTKRIINNLVKFGKPTRFYVIDEEQGAVSSLHGSLETEQDKIQLLKAIQDYRSNKDREKAVERYYVQSVNTIQRVILEQFDDWKELLHQIYPQSEWKQLDSDLLMMQQDLIKNLEFQWQHCLKENNTQGDNPYRRRISNKRMDTSTLDKALSDYEREVEDLWVKTRQLLKEKTTLKLIPDSVNALRALYLEEVSLGEQLKRNKLVTRDNIKLAGHEKRKAKRIVASALDVNGAMLKYSDGNLKHYRQPYIHHQIKLMAKDITKEINQSSLDSNIKKELIERVNKADSLIALELILIDYETQGLRPQHKSQKYRMQPVIHELIRVHMQSGAETNPEIQQIKNIYLDNVVDDIIQQLEESLSWAKEENRGFLYFLERTAAKNAAHELLGVVEVLKKAQNPDDQKHALKNLFKKLSQHQAQLNGVWLFSFGHKNIRDSINHTLNTFNDLTVIGSDEHALSTDFINECREEAQTEAITQKILAVLKSLEKRHSPWLGADEDWLDVIGALAVIHSDNPSLYGLAEMYHWISLKCDELIQTQRPITDPMIHLRGTLRSLWNQVSDKHQDLLDTSRYFSLKAAQVKSDLERVPGFKMNDVQLIQGSNGNEPFYDLIVKGVGSLPLLDDFSRYNSQLAQMQKDLDRCIEQLEFPLTRHMILERLRDKQLQQIKEGKTDKIQISWFPVTQQSNVTAIIELKKCELGEFPMRLADFPEKIQHNFFDRQLINSLDLKEFMDKKEIQPAEIQRVLEQLGRLKDVALRSELIAFIQKLHPVHTEVPAVSMWSPKTWISGFISLWSNPFKITENEEDLRYQLTELLSRPGRLLHEYLTTSAQQRIGALAADLDRQIADEANKIDVFRQKIRFIEERIAVEQEKGGVFIRRFANVGELYDFEQELRQYQAEYAEVTAVAEHIGDEDNDVLDADTDELTAQQSLTMY